MKRTNRNKAKRNHQSKFNFDNLEARQLMAADLLIPTPDFSPLGPETVQLSHDATPSRADDHSNSPQQTDLTIPSTDAEARTFDGTGNNQTNPELGSTGQQLLRIAPADYADGVSDLAGENRVSARVISNALAAQEEGSAGNERGLSAFVYVWGQFLDHDLGLTSVNDAMTETADIEVPNDDSVFDPTGSGTQTISFERSIFDIATGTGTDNPRQQINELTAFIDGSMIYGADQATADSLRSFTGGQLLIGADGLPPVDADGYFYAGDERVNENVELTSMHSLFIREHNQWADRIAAENPDLTDEANYQQARAIVIGEIQAITYNEYLPALLGEGSISDYSGYDSTVNPEIANEFSTAAYRLHTTVNDDVEFFGNDGRAVQDEVPLSEAFFNPDLLRETGIDSILKYVASTQSQEIDTQVVDSLRNFLFGQPGAGGLDLASLNIQRGRDHGLADYNTTREAYGLERVENFSDITSNEAMQEMLSEVYDSVDDIDLWVGMFAEDHVAGSSMGETAQAIIVDQFERVRDGDRLWYENVYSDQSLNQIDSTSLADVISRNTEINNLQENVFFMNAEVSGQVFVDSDSNGRQDRREQGIANVGVELLNDEGSVLATTQTDTRGDYQFDNFLETGDYQIRVLLPTGMTASTSTTKLVLISRGGESIDDVNFGLATGNDNDGNRDPRRGRGQALDRLRIQRAQDLAFTDFGLDTNENLRKRIRPDRRG